MKGLSFKRLAICLAIAASPAIALAQPGLTAGNNTPERVFSDNLAAYPSENAMGMDDGVRSSNPHDDAGSLITCSNLPLAQQEVCDTGPAHQDIRGDQSDENGAAVLPPTGSAGPCRARWRPAPARRFNALKSCPSSAHSAKSRSVHDPARSRGA